MSTPRRPLLSAPRFLPLVGAAVGTVGGGVYWCAAQVWPTSVAVVLAMLAMTLLTARMAAASGAPAGSPGMWGVVFAVLIKYSALMGLSTASLPFAVPANVALGIILVAGNAASVALAVSMNPGSYASLGVALALGFAPAALIGVPGLSGLAAAIVGRIVYGVSVRRRLPSAGTAQIDTGRQLTEACFYLGALATRAYI
jgi:hypothetical protein